MKALSYPITKSGVFKNILVDIGAILFIYFVPTISHIINLPIYLIEPMRLMLILALVHTNKWNAYLIALTLPVFSFLISGHPILPKMMIITFELFLNVYLFYVLKDKIKHLFPSILLSIISSKVIYYIIKFSLIKLMFIDTILVSTPIVIQVITTLVFSSYLYMFYSKNQYNKN